MWLCTRQVAMARSLLGMREYQRAARILGNACRALVTRRQNILPVIEQRRHAAWQAKLSVLAADGAQ